MSRPPYSDLVWVRVDSYTSEPAAATVEAIACAQRLVAVPDGRQIAVSSIHSGDMDDLARDDRSAA